MDTFDALSAAVVLFCWSVCILRIVRQVVSGTNINRTLTTAIIVGICISMTANLEYDALNKVIDVNSHAHLLELFKVGGLLISFSSASLLGSLLRDRVIRNKYWHRESFHLAATMLLVFTLIIITPEIPRGDRSVATQDPATISSYKTIMYIYGPLKVHQIVLFGLRESKRALRAGQITKATGFCLMAIGSIIGMIDFGVFAVLTWTSIPQSKSLVVPAMLAPPFLIALGLGVFVWMPWVLAKIREMREIRTMQLLWAQCISNHPQVRLKKMLILPSISLNAERMRAEIFDALALDSTDTLSEYGPEYLAQQLLRRGQHGSEFKICLPKFSNKQNESEYLYRLCDEYNRLVKSRNVREHA